MRTRFAASLIVAAASYLGVASNARAQGYYYQDPAAARIRQRIDEIRARFDASHQSPGYELPDYQPGWTPDLLQYRRELQMRQRRDIYGNPYFYGRPTPREVWTGHSNHLFYNPYLDWKR